MYGVYHNANVEDIINEKCKAFMMLRSIFSVSTTFENEYEEVIYNIQTEQDLNSQVRKYPIIIKSFNVFHNIVYFKIVDYITNLLIFQWIYLFNLFLFLFCFFNFMFY